VLAIRVLCFSKLRTRGLALGNVPSSAILFVRRVWILFIILSLLSTELEECPGSFF